MSRTDAHAPFHVRFVRGEITGSAVHSCDRIACPLVDDAVVGSCYWEYLYEGRNWCPCWMCHWHRRPEYRRAAERARLRDVARAWNGGDDGAVEEL